MTNHSKRRAKIVSLWFCFIVFSFSVSWGYLDDVTGVTELSHSNRDLHVLPSVAAVFNITDHKHYFKIDLMLSTWCDRRDKYECWEEGTCHGKFHQIDLSYREPQMICAIGITSSLVLVSFNVQSVEDHKREPHFLVGAWLVQITDAIRH